MDNWQEAKLAEVFEINPTEYLKKGQIAKKVTMDLLQPFTKRPITYHIEPFNGGMKFRNGDTIVARITPCLENGKTAFIDFLEDGEVAFGSTEYIVLREKEGVSDKQFVYYFSISPDFRDVAILSMTGSSGRQRVQTDVVRSHTFKIPPLAEQKAITAVLSSLDDKIDLLHRQNHTLQALAETLFRHHFIENPKPHWPMTTLREEFDFTMGQSPPGNSYNEDGVGMPMFQGNADFGFRFPQKRVFTTEPRRLAEPLDTLISVRAPVGAQNMAREKCCIGRGVAAFRYRQNNTFHTYTYYKLRSLMNEIIKFNDEGTVFGSISKTDFEAINLLMPPIEIVQQFEDKVKPIDGKLIENCTQIQTLEALRDTLLPKLIRGEVRLAI